jgi:hypothetical protein
MRYAEGKPGLGAAYQQSPPGFGQKSEHHDSAEQEQHVGETFDAPGSRQLHGMPEEGSMVHGRWIHDHPDYRKYGSQAEEFHHTVHSNSTEQHSCLLFLSR